MSFDVKTARDLLYSLPQHSQLNLTITQHHHIIQHSELVAETAESLLLELKTLSDSLASEHANALSDLPELNKSKPWLSDTELTTIRCGALLHDLGKALHPNELSGSGNQHEVAGYNFCLSQEVPLSIARCCITHSQWHRWFDASGAYIGCDDYDWPLVSDDVSSSVTADALAEYLPDLLVALADTLWKGVRRELLESLVIDALFSRGNLSSEHTGGSQPSNPPIASSRQTLAYWQFSMSLDGLFESIASDGDRKLQRSQTTDAVDLALLRQLSVS